VITTFPATPLSAADWHQVGDDLDAVGCASTPRLLTPPERRELAGLYDRPLRTARGWSAAPVRHGVGTVLSGRRRALGLVFHDA
jgi:hypothetical protein